MSSDSEYEDEELYVFADFENQLLPKEINTYPIKIIGVESEEPVAEINGNIFKGKYDFALGTLVFFEKDNENAEVDDTLFEVPCKQKYNYLGKANKVINFQRIYVDKIEKETKGGADDDDIKGNKRELRNQTEENKINNLKVNMGYNDAIGQFPSTNQANQ